ncbi:hypothetical protein QZH41_011898, partial [Actinostola sp. cb2023]
MTVAMVSIYVPIELPVTGMDWNYHSEFVNLVGKYCGRTLPADVVSSGRYLYLTFSNTSITMKGFRIEYKAVKKPGCGLSNLTAETGLAKYLTTPNFPDNYPGSLNCTWRITSPAGHLVQLIFTDFDTLRDQGSLRSCKYSDSLNIYDSHSEFVNLVGKYCGSTVPADVVSSGRYLYLTFSGVFYATRKGFRIEYRAVKKP